MNLGKEAVFAGASLATGYAANNGVDWIIGRNKIAGVDVDVDKDSYEIDNHEVSIDDIAGGLAFVAMYLALHLSTRSTRG